MKKYLFMLFSVLLTSSFAVSQTITIKGRVMSSEDNLPVIGAIVRLLPLDTVSGTANANRGTVTDSDGRFSLVGSPQDTTVIIRHMGHEDFVIQVSKNKAEMDLGTITLEVLAKSIGDVTISIQGSMVKIKGDTIQYDASKFKTNPDATAEDLVKKMPGVTTDADGNISAQGEKIAKVLVDGKKFFDDDPSFALKSLSSDAVESVEMFNDKSEDAKFSGFDDGERIKTINIRTKEGARQSIMGNAFVGYGTDDRYIAGVRLNSLKVDNSWTLVAQAHNIGRQAFAFANTGGGARGFGGRGMMHMEGFSTAAFQTSAYSEISPQNMLALNYSTTLGKNKKVKLTGSYRFGNFEGTQNSSTRRENQMNLSDYSLEQRKARNLSNNHNLYLEVEWKPNEKNKITFTPNLTYSLSSGNSYRLSEVRGAGVGTDLNSEIKNNTKYEQLSGSAGLWWQHAMKKPGRVLSLGGNFSANNGFGDRDQYSLSENVSKMLIDTIDQIGMLRSSGYSVTGSMTFSEQISQRSRLSVNYKIGYNRTFADQDGFNWEEFDQQYSLVDIATTNYLHRNYTTHTVGLGYNYVNGKKITLTANLDYLLANQNTYQDQPILGQINNRHFFRAFQPNLSLRFNPSSSHTLSANVYMSAGFPTTSQLQDVLDITDPLNVRKGNPELNQSYSTQMQLFYNWVDVVKNRNFNIMLFGSQTNDYIGNNTKRLTEPLDINGTILAPGTRYTTYENLDGYWNLRAHSTYSQGIKPIKSNMSISAYYGLSRQPSIQDDIKYTSMNNNIGLGLSLTSNISEKIDFTLQYYPSISLSTAMRNSGNDKRFGHDVSAIFNIYLTNKLFISGNATWRNSFGDQANYSQHYALLNAAVGYKLLKNNQAEIKLQAYDILKQNQNSRYSMSDIYLTSVNNYDVLTQYFMLSFTYTFKPKNTGAADPNQGYPGGMGGGQGRIRMQH